MKMVYWTPEDEEYLKNNYYNKFIWQLAKTLKRSEAAVRQKAQRMVL